MGHSVGSPYRVLRSYVFDDNAVILGHGSSPRSRTGSGGSTNSDSSEFSARHLFSGSRNQMLQPTIYIPGHGHILPPAPRPPVHSEWTNPRDYWRSRQRVNSSNQLAPVRNPSLSMITEEINSMSGTTAQNLAPNDHQRTSTPIDNRQNLLVDIHCTTTTEDEVDNNS